MLSSAFRGLKTEAGYESRIFPPAPPPMDIDVSGYPPRGAAEPLAPVLKTAPQ